MSKELDKLENAFRKQEEVSPRANSKADAINLAMQAFEEEKISTASQGIESDARLNQQGNEEKPLFDWKNKMKTLNSKFGYSLMGGASLAVLAFVMVGPNLSEFTTLDDQPEVASVNQEVQSEAAAKPKAELADEDEVRIQEVPVSEPAPTVSKVPAARAEAPVEEDVEIVEREAKEVSGAEKLGETIDQKLTDDEKRSALALPSANRHENLVEQLLKKLASAQGELATTQYEELRRQREEQSRNTKKKKSVSKFAKNYQKFGAAGSVKRDPNLIISRMAPAQSSQPLPVPADVITPQAQSRDKFEEVKSNPVKSVVSDPVSTFSVDVDTASYAFMRSSLNNNQTPDPASVRIEELINYFDYQYQTPTDKSAPFKANVQIMPTPWNEGTKLMSIGIKGYELGELEKPDSNLVFLIDTSGSMRQQNKLPLLRHSFKLLLNSLKPTDTISIVAYAGSAGTVLEPTLVKDKRKILAALDRLHAGSSTAGGAGLRQAYALAEENSNGDGVNRVILATDGDFNVGISDPEQLKRYVEKKRKTGVTLSVLGFGRGNYNDELMQKLAQNGNGNAAYIDTLSEARKVLVEEAGSTLFTIAKDVKLQVEFNPGLVSEYRLIGYETRALKREDFNNDKIDAGDIGAGHTVTALYEITPVGSNSQNVDPLRYAEAKKETAEPVVNANPNEYGFMKISYKLPDGDKSTLISTPITLADEVDTLEGTDQDARFASAVAAFGQLLKGGEFTGEYSYDEIVALAQSAKGEDEFGYRAEFINLVRLAKSVEGVQ